METARNMMDLTLTQMIHNFTNIHYVIPHRKSSDGNVRPS